MRIQDSDYEFIDLRGAWSDNTKWIHLFEDVTAVVFVVGLDAYDQTVSDDEDEMVRLFHNCIESTV